MFVEFSSDAAVVHEATDLKRLSVRVQQGAAPSPGRDGLHGLGEFADDGQHVWLYIEPLKAAAAAAAAAAATATLPAHEQAEWSAGFDGMIAYAISKGWANADGTAVRAHVEH
jgi:hypothetical protein